MSQQRFSRDLTKALSQGVCYKSRAEAALALLRRTFDSDREVGSIGRHQGFGEEDWLQQKKLNIRFVPFAISVVSYVPRPKTASLPVIAHDNPALAANICYKGTAVPLIHNHKDRLTKPENGG